MELANGDCLTEMNRMRLINGDCLKEMDKLIGEGVRVDMVLTSPPYDNLRDYGKDFTGWGEHIWKPCLDKIFSILKDGGVCVWVVNDATIKGSETGTSFKQALYWMEIGGKLHDTMIYEKTNPMPLNNNRYTPSFEYMFVFSKNKPKTVNLIEEKSIYAGHKNQGTYYQKDGTLVNKFGVGKAIKDYKVKSNIFRYAVGGKSNGHPAVFPLKLAKEQIISWSNEGDTVLDPFMGSGTTGVACIDLNRDFIGIELDEGYFNIAEKRIKEAQSQGRLF